MRAPPSRLTVVFGIGLALFAACSNKEAAPPPPMAVEQAPAKLDEAFHETQAKARRQVSAEAQALLDDAVASLKARDFGKAVFALQRLLGRSDLTPEQRETASSALLAANQALADQAAAGDQRAQELLQMRRATK